MRASLNVNSVKKTDTINVSVNPITNVSLQSALAERGQSPLPKGLPPESHEQQTTTTEQQTEQNPYANIQTNSTSHEISQSRTVAYDDWESIIAENKALKLVIDIMNNNPLIVNKYIIADDETLMDLIKTLTQADDVQIDADDLAQGCITSKSYRKVHNIFIIKNNSTQNLKYDFPAVLKLLLELKISIKFVY